MTTTNVGRSDLDRQIERIGWGLFLIMLGGLGLVPQTLVPQGSWLIGVGLILLGVNAARALYNLHVSMFTLGLGVLALLIGLSDMLGADVPIVPVFLIIIGASILVRNFREKSS